MIKRSVSMGLLSLPLVAALTAGTATAGPGTARYANDTEGIFWFMHISDSHIGLSWLEPGHPVENLTFALNEGVQAIKPLFVVNTGDLVDGSANDIPTSGQDQREWDSYRAILTAAKMTPSIYYDVIGNHDEYGNKGVSYYLWSSLQGSTKGLTHFSWTHTTPLGKYFFYGLNTVGDNVPAFSLGDGTLTDAEYDSVKLALASNTDAQLSFVFAHHRPNQPKNSQRLVDLIGQREAFFLHGHVHQYEEYLSGNGKSVVNQVNSLGKGDVDNLAVGVVDHNAFVYRSTSTKAPWPLVIITAPVSRTLREGAANPWAYKVCRDRSDAPVRAVVFSKVAPASVKARFANLPEKPMTAIPTVPGLWQAQFDVRALAAGPQTVTVTAVAGGVSRNHSISIELADCSTGGPDMAAPADMTAPADGAMAGGDLAGLPDLGAGQDLVAAEDLLAEEDLAEEADLARKADLKPAAKPDLRPARDLLDPEADASEEPPPPDGCSCRVASRSDGSPLPLAAVALLLGLALRRRRR